MAAITTIASKTVSAVPFKPTFQNFTFPLPFIRPINVNNQRSDNNNENLSKRIKTWQTADEQMWPMETDWSTVVMMSGQNGKSCCSE